MQIRNALRGIDHGEIRACGKSGVNGGLDFSFLRIAFEALVQITQTVVGIDAQFLEQVGVLREYILEEHAHERTEQHRVRDLHHGGLQVYREQQTLRLRFGHRIGDELFERSHAHHGGVDDFALQERLCGTEFRDFACFVDKFNLERVGVGHGDGLFVAVKVVGLHACHMRLYRSVPVAVAVRVVAGKVLHCLRGATVGVALAKHRVHGGALYLVVLRADCLFFFSSRSVRIVGHVKAIFLEFGNGCLELRHRSRNVRELDDVCVRFKRKLAEEIQVVARLAEGGQNATRQRDVLGFYIDIGGLCKTANDGEQGLSRQEGRFICKGIVNLGIHTSPKIDIY